MGFSPGKRGFTLAEVMVVSLVIMISVVALWRVYMVSLDLIIKAKELRVAADDLKDVFEKIRSVAFSDILDVFPDGGSVSPSVVGGFLLSDESIVVSYPDGTDANPLTIKVTITWTGKDGRVYTRSFYTMRAKELL